MSLNSKLYIETEYRGGRSILKKSFAGQPFKLADVTEDKTQNCLQLIVMNSSPGILDGDEYKTEIIVGENSRLQLQTQSYQRLFTMKFGASQLVDVHLQKGACITCLPHPVVPHKNSGFLSRNNIHMQSGCRLVWGEVMSCGRAENGEVFLFSSYHNITQIFLNEKLVVKENILLKPKTGDLFSIGQMEGFTHQATLVYLDENVEVEALKIIIIEKLSDQENIAFGISKLPVNGLIVRLLGFKAEQLFNLSQMVSETIQPINQKTNVGLLNVT